MMQCQLRLLCIFSLYITLAHADLTCILWKLLTSGGLKHTVCHVAPTKLQAVEQASVKAVEEAVQAGADLVQFDITHSPITVAFEFVSKTVQGKDASGYVGEVAMDYVNVTIGAAKEATNTANSVIQLVNLLDWTDVSLCEVESAIKLATAPDRRRNPHTKLAIDPEEGAKALAGCISKEMSTTAIFNITDPNQKVGATISDIGFLFVPVPVELDVTAGTTNAARSAVDLGIVDNEAATRIMKRTTSGSTTPTWEHFADEEEALRVQEKLTDSEWVGENCFAKQPSLGAFVPGQVSRRTAGRPLPATLPDVGCNLPPAEVAMTKLGRASSHWGGDASHGPIIPTEIDFAAEVPKLETHSLGDIAGIRQDASKESTALIKWSDNLQKITKSSEDIMSKFRSFFENPDDPIAQKLHIAKDENDYWERKMIQADQVDLNDPDLAFFKDFASTCHDDIKAIAKDIYGMDDFRLEEATLLLHIMYYPPDAVTSIPNYLHVDDMYLTLISSDKDGLVVGNSDTLKVYRPPVVPDAWYLVNGNAANSMTQTAGEEITETYHAVWRDGIPKDARISIVVGIP